jgi:acetate kinase
MGQAIIVVNAGSSSLKFSLYAVADSQLNLQARGQIDGLGTSPHFKVKDHQATVLTDGPLKDSGKLSHADAFAHVAEWMREHYGNEHSMLAIGHRIVHGGTQFIRPILIDDAVLNGLEKLVPLMPLHLPPNLAAVHAVRRTHPNLPQVACFDTSFHHDRPKLTQKFALPHEMFDQGIRRYGFHGLSYEYIASQLPKISPELAAGRVIVAHLGNGASLCAMRRGRSVDTTMSFSTLDGLPMGTRCGSLDPGVLLYLLQQGMSPQQIEELLYKKSGLLGISGVSNDVRDLLDSNDPRAAEAIDFFVYRIIREIGSLTATLGGLDGLIFTAGVGENSALIRQRVCEGLAWLNISIDPTANRKNSRRISPTDKTPSVWVIPTDEESVIASHTLTIVRAKH